VVQIVHKLRSVTRIGVFAASALAACTHATQEPSFTPAPAAEPVASAPASRPEPSAASRIVQSGAIAEQRDSVTISDLDRRTSELFGAALKLDASIDIPKDSGALQIAEAPTWDIEVHSYETFDRVRYYTAAFSGRLREYITERLSRGTRYEQLIRSRLRAGGLPEDMYYLALVESGFNPHAYSSAAAVGMWQFMSTTAQGMGLRVDWWVDERRDPVRSTEAAVRFLRGLNEQFGSLYLAAAAYNGGPGRVARGLTRYANELEGTTGDDIFFALAEKKYLRNETREYVPQLIAAALVAKEPDRYGLTIEQREPFAYDSVRIGPRVSLAAVAIAAGTTVAVLQDLNPYLLRGMTPPKDSLKVRIPAGTRAHFDSAFAQLTDDDIVAARWVTAEKGATWATLAKKAKLSPRALPLYNPKVKAAKTTGRIVPGTPILVPTAAVVAAAFPVPDPSIERYGGGNRTHVVRKGENLSTIAKHYGTTPAAIMRINRLKKPLIFPGQELMVNARASSGRAAKSPTQKKKALTSSR
jgi:membrane-bound lytic murein transglycosylase D